MLERELEEKFRRRVKAAGGQAYKFVSPGNDGVPDRLVVLPGGRIGFVELKQKGRRPTALQQKRILELRSLGCVVMVLDRLEDMDTVLERIREAQT